jgi:ribosome modulation factor
MSDETELPEHWEDTPYNRGYYANAYQDRPKSDCPYGKYEIGSRDQWVEGWETADRDTSWTRMGEDGIDGV